MKKFYLALGILVAFTQTSYANEKVEIESRFDIADVSTIILNVNVGEVTLETHQSNEVIIDVVVKESDNRWFSKADLDDIKLSKEISQQNMYLEVDAEDTNQDWKITVPQSVNLKLEIGVGRAHLSDVAKDIDIDLGVGDANIYLANDDYSRIELETGVGDAKLDGFSDVKSKRSLVSKTIDWDGKGHYEINVDVGVGDVKVNLD